MNLMSILRIALLVIALVAFILAVMFGCAELVSGGAEPTPTTTITETEVPSPEPVEESPSPDPAPAPTETPRPLLETK